MLPKLNTEIRSKHWSRSGPMPRKKKSCPEKDWLQSVFVGTSHAVPGERHIFAPGASR